MFHFVRGEWSEANRWVMTILGFPEGSERQDIRDFARIFQVFLQFELGNLDLNEYLVRSTYRYMSRNRRYNDFERAILKFIRSTLQTVGKQERHQILRDFLADVEGLQSRYGRKSILGLDEVVFWAQAREEGISVAEFYQRSVRNNQYHVEFEKEKASSEEETAPAQS